MVIFSYILDKPESHSWIECCVSVTFFVRPWRISSANLSPKSLLYMFLKQWIIHSLVQYSNLKIQIYLRQYNNRLDPFAGR